MHYIRAVLALLICAASVWAQGVYTGVHRIVAVGDVHGDFQTFVTILRSAGVIDKSNKWIGGDTHLVQLGDSVDRGPESRKVLDLLLNLEKQAARSKGMVHALIGNHEAMNIYGDLRYVSAADYQSYRTGQSEELRDRAYEANGDPARKDDEAYRGKWNDEHPLGWVEQRQAFAANGRYGKALLEHDAVVKINDMLFMHGGISEKFITSSIAEINQKVRAELRDFRLLDHGFSTDDIGPLWYRGLALEPEVQISGLVDKILASYGVSHVVVGHTPTTGAVMPRLGAKVLIVDVGLSKFYNESPACLLVEDGRLFTIHRGAKIAIPSTSDITSYLQQVAAEDPPGSNLRKSLGLR